MTLEVGFYNPFCLGFLELLVLYRLVMSHFHMCISFFMCKHISLQHGTLYVGAKIALDCDGIDVRGFCEDFWHLSELLLKSNRFLLSSSCNSLLLEIISVHFLIIILWF